MKQCMCRKAQQGFALIALAGLLLAASLATATVLVQQDRKQTWDPQIDAASNMREIEDYLVRFQRQNYRLPCPAARNQSPDSIEYGKEVANCHLDTNISGTSRVTTGGDRLRVGVLPVRTLGLPSKLANDAWGNRVTYAVVDKLTDISTYNSSYVGFSIIDSANSTIEGNAAFVIVSHGAKADGAYSSKTGILINSCGTESGKDEENCDADRVFRKIEFNSASGAAFGDDIVSYRPVDPLALSGGGGSSAGGSGGGVLPCIPPNPATPFSWGGGCSGTYANMGHGQSQSIANSVANFSGSADVTCSNGTFTVNASTCTPTPNCPASSVSWNGVASNCSANYPSLAHGATSSTITNTASGLSGTVKVRCNMGVISVESSTCTPKPCDLPWGGTVPHGSSISAFQVGSVSCGNACPQEVRTCSYGVLSGSYTHQSCTANACNNNCTTPWGTTIPHLTRVLAYQTSSVPCGGSCNSEYRTCNNGTLSGSFTSETCSVAVCLPCSLPWGGSISHGNSVAAYSAWSVGCGGSCAGETRTCNNGSLSGSYGAASCSVSPCADCGLPWGGAISHGAAVTAYNTWNAGCGGTCYSETRWCSNGSLSGS